MTCKGNEREREVSENKFQHHICMYEKKMYENAIANLVSMLAYLGHFKINILYLNM